MVIGTNSKSTIFDLFETGYREVVRAMGPPLELVLRTRLAEIQARSSEFDKRVEFYRISFKAKEGVVAEELSQKITDLSIPNQVVMEDGNLAVTLPQFEWRQIKQSGKQHRP